MRNLLSLNSLLLDLMMVKVLLEVVEVMRVTKQVMSYGKMIQGACMLVVMVNVHS